MTTYPGTDIPETGVWWELYDQYGNLYIRGTDASDIDIKQAADVFSQGVFCGLVDNSTIFITGTLFYDDTGMCIGSHEVEDGATIRDEWYSLDANSYATLVAVGAARDEMIPAHAIYGETLAQGITILPKNEGDPTVTKFYDVNGNFLGEHTFHPSRWVDPRGNYWTDISGNIIATSSGAGETGESLVILGNDVARGIRIYPEGIEGTVGINKFYDQNWKLIGEREFKNHITDLYDPANSVWYKIGEDGITRTMIAQGATRSEMINAIAIFGNQIKEGITLLPGAVITKFFDINGNFFAQHDITNNRWTDANGNIFVKNSIVIDMNGHRYTVMQLANGKYLAVDENGNSYYNDSATDKSIISNYSIFTTEITLGGVSCLITFNNRNNVMSVGRSYSYTESNGAIKRVSELPAGLDPRGALYLVHDLASNRYFPILAATTFTFNDSLYTELTWNSNGVWNQYFLINDLSTGQSRIIYSKNYPPLLVSAGAAGKYYKISDIGGGMYCAYEVVSLSNWVTPKDPNGEKFFSDPNWIFTITNGSLTYSYSVITIGNAQDGMHTYLVGDAGGTYGLTFVSMSELPDNSSYLVGRVIGSVAGNWSATSLTYCVKITIAGGGSEYMLIETNGFYYNQQMYGEVTINGNTYIIKEDQGAPWAGSGIIIKAHDCAFGGSNYKIAEMGGAYLVKDANGTRSYSDPTSGFTAGNTTYFDITMDGKNYLVARNNSNNSLGLAQRATSADTELAKKLFGSADITCGITMPSQGADEPTITIFYDSNGNEIGRHSVGGPVARANGVWYKADARSKSGLKEVARDASADEMKLARDIFGSSVTAGIITFPANGGASTPETTVITTLFYDGAGNIIGGHRVTYGMDLETPPKEEWYTMDGAGRETLIAKNIVGANMRGSAHLIDSDLAAKSELEKLLLENKNSIPKGVSVVAQAMPKKEQLNENKPVLK